MLAILVDILGRVVKEKRFSLRARRVSGHGVLAEAVNLPGVLRKFLLLVRNEKTVSVL
jgi:hypothetical protein